MNRYNVGADPFDAPWTGGDRSPRVWWEVVHRSAPQLADLAIILLDACPHSVAPERTFSAMGWCESSRRSCLGVGTNAMLATMKMHYDQFPSEGVRR